MTRQHKARGPWCAKDENGNLWKGDTRWTRSAVIALFGKKPGWKFYYRMGWRIVRVNVEERP